MCKTLSHLTLLTRRRGTARLQRLERAPGLSSPGVGWASLGIITGPNWRPRLPDSQVVEGALVPPCPTHPQLPGTQFQQPLGVGTLRYWVLEPPFPRRGGLSFPVRQGQGAVVVKGGGGGESSIPRRSS